MQIQLRVNLTKPVTGKAIADAVRQIADLDYYQEIIFAGDEVILYHIGRNSSYPFEDLLIGVGPNATPKVAMKAVYDEVYVLSWEHSGLKYAVRYTDTDVVNALSTFRDLIQAAL